MTPNNLSSSNICQSLKTSAWCIHSFWIPELWGLTANSIQSSLKRTSLNFCRFSLMALTGSMGFNWTVNRFIDVMGVYTCVWSSIGLGVPDPKSAKHSTWLCVRVCCLCYACVLNCSFRHWATIWIIIVETKLRFGCSLSCITLVRFNNTVKISALLTHNHTIFGLRWSLLPWLLQECCGGQWGKK